MEVHLAIDQLGYDVHARLALGNRKTGAIQAAKALGQRLELLGILNERLHLLLASHRTKETKHAVDRGRDGARCRILHGVKSKR